MAKDQNISPHLLTRYLEGSCTEEEAYAVEKWYSGLHPGENEEQMPELDKSLHLMSIRARIEAIEGGPGAPEDRNLFSAVFQGFRRYAAAIILCLLCMGGLYLYQSGRYSWIGKNETLLTNYKNNKKQIAKYILPDGSTIWMNPGSSLSYAKDQFLQVEREVALQGEAFFDVVPNPDRPFIVSVGDMRVRVLGTSFLVRPDPAQKDYEVAVMTGKVQVYSSAANGAASGAVELNPSEKAKFEMATGTVASLKEKGKDETMEPWKIVSLTFSDERMDAVAARLEAKFGVKMSFEKPELANCFLKATFDQYRLAEILDNIAEMLELTYEIDGKTILLKGKGCGA